MAEPTPVLTLIEAGNPDGGCTGDTCSLPAARRGGPEHDVTSREQGDHS